MHRICNALALPISSVIKINPYGINMICSTIDAVGLHLNDAQDVF
jgi:hypothetical protein